MKIVKEPQPRFEHSHAGVITVLEGAELYELFENFFNYFNSKDSAAIDFWEKFWPAALQAYENVHGKDAVGEALRYGTNLNADADARKIDLFCRGMLCSLAQLAEPDNDWECVFSEPNSYLEIANEITKMKQKYPESKLGLKELLDQISQSFNRD